MRDAREEFRFDYRGYKTRHIDLSMLDLLMKSILSAGTGTIATIVAGVKLLVFTAYLYARKRLIDEQYHIEKQEYEQRRSQTNDRDINRDDLD